MAKLTAAMKEAIEKAQFCDAATADRQRLPNVSPKGSIMWLNDETIAFCDWDSIHTRQNLRENQQIAISIVNPQAATTRFVRSKGTVDLASSGRRYREIADKYKEKIRKTELPEPTTVVIVHVDEIFAFPPLKCWIADAAYDAPRVAADGNVRRPVGEAQPMLREMP